MPVRISPKTEKPPKPIELRNIMAGQLFRFSKDKTESVFLKTLEGFLRLTSPYDSLHISFDYATDKDANIFGYSCITLDRVTASITND